MLITPNVDESKNKAFFTNVRVLIDYELNGEPKTFELIVDKKDIVQGDFSLSLSDGRSHLSVGDEWAAETSEGSVGDFNMSVHYKRD